MIVLGSLYRYLNTEKNLGYSIQFLSVLLIVYMLIVCIAAF